MPLLLGVLACLLSLEVCRVGAKAALETGAGLVIRLARVVLDGGMGEATGGLLPLAWVGLF